ncbi:MAG: AI-2E family transporter [Patescibacteria group bacterium]
MANRALNLYTARMNTARRYQNQFFFILLGIALLLAFFILKPFLNICIVALACAIILMPIQRFFLRILRRFPGISAILTICITLAVIATPLIIILIELIRETEQVYASLSVDASTLNWLIQNLQNSIRTVVPNFSIDLPSYVQPTIRFLASSVAAVFTTTVFTIIQLFIFFVGLFILLRDGHQLKQWLVDVSPLPEQQSKRIILRVKATITSVLRGSLFIAIIQGTLAGAGFAFVGVPNPIFWGTITAIAALAPGIGTALVMIPMTAYLFITKQYVPAIELGIWAIAIVGTIDNVLRPMIVAMGKDVRIPSFLILLSVLGGLSLFGPLGFIIGPTVLSFLLALIDVYREYILHEDEWEIAHEDGIKKIRAHKMNKSA